MKISQLLNPTPPMPDLTMRDAYFLKVHGLSGRVLKNGFNLSAELKAICVNHTTSHFIRYEVYKEELNKFLKVFPDAVAVKGMSLIPRIYQDPSIREVTDIDIYYPFDLQPIHKYFADNNFCLALDKWEGNNFKLNATKIVNAVEVPFEIHQKLLWECDINWEIKDDESFKTLRIEDELIYLSGHLAFQHTMLSLHWLIDIALLLQLEHQWDCQRLNDILAKAPLKNSLSTCLWAVERYFDVKVPTVLRPYILKNQQNRLIQRLLTEDFLKESMGMRFNYYLLKHLLKDSVAQSIKYDILWLKHKLWT